MNKYLFSGILLLDCSACHPLHHMYRLQKIPDGTWVCDQDTPSSLVYKRDISSSATTTAS